MLDTDFVHRKINLIREDLVKLESLKGTTFQELSKDWLKWNALEHILMKIIGRGIDINEHLITELAKPETKAPSTYRETFLRLAELKVMPEEFAGEISKSAGFRNAVVHEYNQIDKEAVFKTVDEAIKQYTDYCQYILGFLDSLKENEEKESD